MLARVFTVVDTYDALVSTRPHKVAWTQAQALEEIGLQADYQLGPGVVAAFLALYTPERAQ